MTMPYSPFMAKLTWIDPATDAICTHILMEGATATLGRSSENDIAILDKHVSRRHAVIRYSDGVFTIADLGSANGTFVNDKQVIEPFPLFFWRPNPPLCATPYLYCRHLSRGTPCPRNRQYHRRYGIYRTGQIDYHHRYTRGVGHPAGIGFD